MQAAGAAQRIHADHLRQAMEASPTLKALLIRSTRGTVRIIDREGLFAIDDGLYGVPEAECQRLLG